MPNVVFSYKFGHGSELLYLHVGSPYALHNNTKFTIDSSNLSVRPYTSNGRTMMPVRFLASRLNIEVFYEHHSNKVTLMSAPAISIVPGEDYFTVGGKKQELDVPAEVIAERIFLPAAAVVRALGINIAWNDGLIIIGEKSEEELMNIADEHLIRKRLINSDFENGDDLQVIKERLRKTIESTSADPTNAMAQWSEDGSFEGVDYQSTARSNWSPLEHVNYVRTMLKAAYSQGNSYYGDKDLKEKIEKSLTYWATSNRATSDNWWYEDIGLPQVVADILLFEPEGLTQDVAAVLNAEASKGSVFNETDLPDRITERPVSSTGANLTDKLITSFKIAVATNNEEELYDIIGLLENELRVFPKKRTDEFGEDAEGIKPDYSFHQHVDQVQMGGYGEVFLTGVNTILHNIKGTKFMLSYRALNEYANFLLDGMQWAMRGEYKDFTVTGRGFSRPNGIKGIYGGLKRAVELLEDIYQLDRHSEIIELKNNRLSGNGDVFSGNKHFWQSDFMAHKRDNFHIGIKLASNRTKLGEVINNENLLGYYMSDGVTVIMPRGDEYENIFPVWDWNKIPGTTTLQGGLKDLRNHYDWLGEHLWNWKGKDSFVGGVSDGMYGAAVMDYTRDGMYAQKAWFMFDNEMVALGNSINTYTDMEVYTSINQCLLSGGVVQGDGFIYHDGVGYVSDNSMDLVTEKREGLWETINLGHKDKPEEKEVFQLGINHGKNPKDASYEYMVVFGKSKEEVSAYKTNSPIVVLHNDDKAQAVYHKELKILQAVIRKGNNTIELPSGIIVRTNKKCMLILKEHENGEVDITVSNPENLPKDLWVYVNRKWPNMSEAITYEDGETTLRFRLPEGAYAGSSLTHKWND
jgi:chondroitin AC lyase